MTEREAIILLTGALYTNHNHKAREALNLAIEALERLELIKQGKGYYARTDGVEGIITRWVDVEDWSEEE